MYPFYDINHSGPCDVAYAWRMASQGWDKEQLDDLNPHKDQFLAQAVRTVLGIFGRVDMSHPMPLQRALRTIGSLGVPSIQRLARKHTVRTERP